MDFSIAQALLQHFLFVHTKRKCFSVAGIVLNEGKEIFFNTYFTKALGMPALTESEKEALFAIDTMTPSDFRNVRQQFFYLDDKCLTNMEVIEALETEIASKKSDSSFKGLGNVVSKMGF